MGTRHEEAEEKPLGDKDVQGGFNERGGRGRNSSGSSADSSAQLLRGPETG